MEVERKFRLRELPDLSGADADPIEQGYLAVGADGEVRLRRKGERTLLTVKRGTGLSRGEAEVEVSPEQFEALWPLTEGRRLTKMRYLIHRDDVRIELDVYDGELQGLMIAEVEFPDERTADDFQPPEWFGEEVTGKGEYLNESLATKGVPAVTAFRLKRKESEQEGIRRAAHGRTADAIGWLRNEDADPVEAVHEARKDLKKLRATLKLVRPALGNDPYRRENERFRDLGRALSDVRDQQVRAETIDKLAERYADDPPPGGWWAIRPLLLEQQGTANGELDSLRERTASAIETGDREIDRWPLDGGGFDLLGPGLRRTYSRARRRFRDACKEPSDIALHEWRKRSKDLWYHLRLVSKVSPPASKRYTDRAHQLSDLLGDDHDLLVLGQYLEQGDSQLTAEQRAHLKRLIERRRRELQEQAFAVGERLFANKPKRFAKRVERHWAVR